jgi:hypothetical protein
MTMTPYFTAAPITTERIKAVMMCQPDRVNFQGDGKPPWLPTRSGELFMPMLAISESSLAIKAVSNNKLQASITFDSVI